MGDAQWETCGAETLLEEFFAQDDLRQLAESAGKILDCPLLVLDDTFHVAAYRLPQGFSDELFQNVVSCGSRNSDTTCFVADPCRNFCTFLHSAGRICRCYVIEHSDSCTDKFT